MNIKERAANFWRRYPVLVSALLYVASLTAYHAWLPSRPVFYFLFPGLATGLLITGGHGGTDFEEAVAPWIAFLVNWLFYCAVLIPVRWAAERSFRLPKGPRPDGDIRIKSQE